MPPPALTGSDAAAAMDAGVASMEKALAEADVAKSSGSAVLLQRYELELLGHMEAARGLMMSVLQGESKERKVLQEVFGGDCSRISKVRALLESAEKLGIPSRGKDRAENCLRACESVENVLADLGLGWALKLAQIQEREALNARIAEAEAALRRAENKKGYAKGRSLSQVDDAPRAAVPVPAELPEALAEKQPEPQEAPPAAPQPKSPPAEPAEVPQRQEEPQPPAPKEEPSIKAAPAEPASAALPQVVSEQKPREETLLQAVSEQEPAEQGVREEPLVEARAETLPPQVVSEQEPAVREEPLVEPREEASPQVVSEQEPAAREEALVGAREEASPQVEVEGPPQVAREEPPSVPQDEAEMAQGAREEEGALLPQEVERPPLPQREEEPTVAQDEVEVAAPQEAPTLPEAAREVSAAPETMAEVGREEPAVHQEVETLPEVARDEPGILQEAEALPEVAREEPAISQEAEPVPEEERDHKAESVVPPQEVPRESADAPPPKGEEKLPEAQEPQKAVVQPEAEEPRKAPEPAIQEERVGGSLPSDLKADHLGSNSAVETAARPPVHQEPEAEPGILRSQAHRTLPGAEPPQPFEPPQRKSSKSSGQMPSQEGGESLEELITSVEDQEQVPSAGFQGLSQYHQRLLQRIFAHYAGGDCTSAGSTLSNTRFRSFMRDIGILGNHSVSSQSARETEHSASASLDSVRRRSSQTASLPGEDSLRLGRRRSVLAGVSVAQVSLSGCSIPLPLFKEPPLSFVQVDLLHVSAVRKQQQKLQKLQSQQALLQAQPVVVNVSLQGQMSFDAFTLALGDITKILKRLAFLEATLPYDEALESFCERVMVPLASALGISEQDVLSAVEILQQQEVFSLLNRVQKGLELVFGKYAASPGAAEPYKRGHWTAQAMRKFAADSELSAELSYPSIQRLFGECVQYDSSEGRSGSDGKMSFSCFKLALVLIAQRVHCAPGCTPLTRVALLLLRLSTSAKGATDLGTAARAILGPASGRTSTAAPRASQRVPSSGAISRSSTTRTSMRM